MALPLSSFSFRDSPDQRFTYADLDFLQKQRAIAIREQDGPGAVYFAEVAPVITLGRAAHHQMSSSTDEANPVPRLPVDRGGLATYHGHGQWVVFVVDRIESLTGETRGVVRLVSKLLESAAQVARELGVSARVSLGDDAGLWTDTGKLASVGVRVQDGIVQHGIAMNVFQTKDSFRGLSQPCGLDRSPAFLCGDADNALELKDFFESKMLSVQRLWQKSLLDQFNGSLYLSASSNSVVGS